MGGQILQHFVRTWAFPLRESGDVGGLQVCMDQSACWWRKHWNRGQPEAGSGFLERVVTQTRMEVTTGKEGSRYVLKAEPVGFTAGWNETWKGGKSAVALRVLAWKQPDGRGCSGQRWGRWGKVQVLGVCQEKFEVSHGHPGGVRWDTHRRAQC